MTSRIWMRQRWNLLWLTVLLFACPGVSAQQDPPSSQARVLDQVPVEIGGRQLQANYIEVTVPPGAESQPHRHGGAVIGFVLDGTLFFAVDDQPERAIPAGGSFVESEGAVHRVSRGHPETGAKILAIILAEPGVPLTTPQ